MKRLLRLLALPLVLCASLMVGCSSQTEDRFTIMLDAGHDINHPGLVGTITENEYTETFVRLLKEELEQKEINVVLTHEDGEASSVSSRVSMINQASPDLVISVHGDAIVDGDRSMPRLVVNPPSSKYNEESLSYANAIVDGLSEDAFVGYLYYTPIRNAYQIHLVDAQDLTDYGEETLDIMSAECPIIQLSLINIQSESDPNSLTDEEIGAQVSEIADIIGRIITE